MSVWLSWTRDTPWLDAIRLTTFNVVSVVTTTGYASVDYTLAPDVDNLVLLGGAIQGFGNGLVNALFGNAANNLLDGAGAADVLTGGTGNDTFVFNVGQADGDTIVDFDGQGAAAGEVLATNVLSHMIQRVLVENVEAEKAVEEAHKKVVEIYARYPEG